MSPDAYRALLRAKGFKAPRDEPEHRLQVEVATWLTRNLRAGIEWIGGAAGLRLGPKVRERAQATGCLRKGWTDLTLLDEHGIGTIELKADGSLTPEQQRFRDFCLAHHHRWALCRSRAAVAETVIGWGMCVEGAKV